MQAVVPAAGRGTRLRPLTDDRPKGMVEVAGRPLLTHCFDQLLEIGIEDLVVVVGYRKEAIVARYGDAYEGVPITYVHQREPKGLADAVRRAEPHVDGPFVLMNGDNVFRANLTDVLERFRSTDADAVLLTERVSIETARTTGVVETDDAGRVRSVVEKPAEPPSTLATTGFSALPAELFDACRLLRPSDRGEYELSDAIDLLARAGARVETVRMEGWRVNVNAPSDVERAERRLEGER